MKVFVTEPTRSDSEIPHRLFMEPETNEERDWIETFAAAYVCRTFGATPDGKPLHCAVEIEPHS